jgi:preprotein translocase subunit SecF
LIDTEIKDEKELNANRQLIEETLRGDVQRCRRKSRLEQLSPLPCWADRLRGPLQHAGVALSEQDLQDLCGDISTFRKDHGGIVRSIDELSGVKGVTPKVIEALKANVSLGPVHHFADRSGGSQDRRRTAPAGRHGHAVRTGGMLVYIAFRFEWIYGVAAVVAVFHDTVITVGLFSLLTSRFR